jgi:hypothetical protein
MNDVFGAIKDTPLPTILVLAGIVFWLLAIAGSLAGKITVQPGQQRTASLVGTVLIVLGLALYFAPAHDPQSETPIPKSADAKPQLTAAPKPGPAADSMKIQSIGPRPGTLLHSGNSPDIQLELIYVLNSADRAFLALYLEEMNGTSDRCNGEGQRTNGGTDVPVVRGEHFAQVMIQWPGSPQTGFLTVGANFWKDVDGHLGDQIAALGHFTEVCYPFGP